MNKIMNRKRELPLPDHDNPNELANEFCSFFQDKVSRIWWQFSNSLDDAFEYDRYKENESCPTAFNNFDHVSEEDIRKIITKSGTKSCELDPLSTCLLKSNLDTLLPVITNIVNASMKETRIPDAFKQAIVRPLLKKLSLDIVISHYRPVSSLPYISKMIEEANWDTINTPHRKQSIGDPLQSAYKPKHSTETALIKVCDESLSEPDRGNAVFLGIMDLSAAFNTVDHSILLSRLNTTF